MVLLAVVHAVIDNLPKLPAPETGLFGLNEPTWIGIGTIAGTFAFLATGALAGGTWWLGYQTRDLVRSSNEERTEAERHHRESLTPLICTFGLSSLVTADVGAEQQLVYSVSLTGTIANVGPGPAAEVSVWFTPSATTRKEFPAAPIGGNSEVKLHIGYEIGTWFAGTANRGYAWPFRCAIRYVSMFGDEGCLVLASHSGRAEDLRVLYNRRPSSTPQPPTLEETMTHFGL